MRKDKILDIDRFDARDYICETGRFLGVDPIMEYYNPYTYVGNHPMNFVDPLGMDMKRKPRGDDGDGSSGGSGWNPPYTGADWRDGYVHDNVFDFCGWGVDNWDYGWQQTYNPAIGSLPGWSRSGGSNRYLMENPGGGSGGYWKVTPTSWTGISGRADYFSEEYPNLNGEIYYNSMEPSSWEFEWVETTNNNWIDGFLFGTGDVEQDIVNFTAGVVVGSAAFVAGGYILVSEGALIAAGGRATYALASEQAYAGYTVAAAEVGILIEASITQLSAFYINNQQPIHQFVFGLSKGLSGAGQVHRPWGVIGYITGRSIR